MATEFWHLIEKHMLVNVAAIASIDILLGEICMANGERISVGKECAEKIFKSVTAAQVYPIE